MSLRRSSSATEASTDLGENDDEAEKEERRHRAASSGSNISSNSSTHSFINSLSPVEIEIQIAQCLKLNAENKINDKNAFQLKMIDFLAYSVKKHDPKIQISNLQMASAYLDVSGKIYGYRVDKVHSDLLKIVGAAKRPREEAEEDANGNEVVNGGQPAKKRRKRKHNCLSTNEALKGNVESYNPLSLMQNNLDAQTSDHLHQSSLPKHANQGILLNLFNDVVLDRLPIERYDSTVFVVPRIGDFLHGQLCPSYDAFQFLGWSVEDEPVHDTSEASEVEEMNGEHHFHMEDPIEEDDKTNGMMDYRDEQDARLNQDQQPLDDFQQLIENNPNPDATYEYSYIQGNYSIHLVRPSHWKVHVKRDARYNGAPASPKKARRKKDIELDFLEETKAEADSRFVLANKPTKLLKATYTNWSDNNISLPDFHAYDPNRFSSYYTNDNLAGDVDAVRGKVENKVEQKRDDGDDDNDDIFNMSHFGNDFHNNSLDLHLDEQDHQIPDNPFMFPDSEPPSQPPAFLGENLVSLPQLTEKVFIPYSQRAKKIDMRQLKKSIRRVLQNQTSKEFSQLYRILPAVLSKTNAQSLSPGLAFTSLLHVAHDKNLTLQSHADLADLTISNCENLQK